MFQELQTWNGYTGKEAFARRCGQEALALICERLAAEEMAHHVFYRDLCELLYQNQPSRFQDTMYGVFESFVMPGAYAEIKGYSDAFKIAMKEGVVPTLSPPRRPEGILVPDRAERLEAQEKSWSRYVKTTGALFPRFGLPEPDTLRQRITIPTLVPIGA